jgi:hypothetical protein
VIMTNKHGPQFSLFVGEDMSSPRGGHFPRREDKGRTCPPLGEDTSENCSDHRPIALTNTIRYCGTYKTNLTANLNSVIRNLQAFSLS